MSGVEDGSQRGATDGVIELRTRRPRLSLRRNVPTVDGQRVRPAWWTEPLDLGVSAGRHVISWGVGAEQLAVEVGPGERVVVERRGGYTRLSRGTVLVLTPGAHRADEAYGFVVGGRVRHGRWGPGTIDDLIPESDRVVAVIAFDDAVVREVDLDREDLVEER